MPEKETLIYFDHAATSWPKPAEVGRAMSQFLDEVGANPGRSGHRLAIAAAEVVFAARETVARLFGAPDPLRVAFGHNVTEALNLALLGYLRPGDHVVAGSLEHNSVMRPLRYLESAGVEVSVVAASRQGYFDPEDFRAAVRPNTVLLAVNHASNVIGTLAPVSEIGRIARDHHALLLVDAAQTGGAYPIDLRTDPIDLLAFTGHKSLYGPTGSGGLIIGQRVDLDRLRPLTFGGTGSRSDSEEQPPFPPDRFESGTLNAIGLAGLDAGVRWLTAQGVDTIRAHEIFLAQRLIDGLTAVPGVTVYGGLNARQQTATVSFNIAGREPSDAALHLDDDYAILCRVGLHCSPSAHKTIGTYPKGAIRFGLGAMNTAEEVDAAVAAVRNLADGAR
jgi:cysteine desulfurase/selenocysteine lyase